MTEEDQKLVALAALHGARFYRLNPVHNGSMWGEESYPKISKWTICRAAEYYLWQNGLRSDAEHGDYDARTDYYDKAQEVDAQFMASVLA